MTVEWIRSYQTRAAWALGQRLPAADLHPGALHQAMRYAVLGGGKRIRPVLVYLSGAAVGAAPKRSMALPARWSSSMPIR